MRTWIQLEVIWTHQGLGKKILKQKVRDNLYKIGLAAKISHLRTLLTTWHQMLQRKLSQTSSLLMQQCFSSHVLKTTISIFTCKQLKSQAHSSKKLSSLRLYLDHCRRWWNQLSCAQMTLILGSERDQLSWYIKYGHSSHQWANNLARKVTVQIKTQCLR